MHRPFLGVGGDARYFEPREQGHDIRWRVGDTLGFFPWGVGGLIVSYRARPKLVAKLFYQELGVLSVGIPTQPCFNLCPTGRLVANSRGIGRI
jgi:hypothetical protein